MGRAQAQLLDRARRRLRHRPRSQKHRNRFDSELPFLFARR